MANNTEIGISNVTSPIGGLDQLAFKVMIFVVLRDGEIAKSELNDISHHSLLNNPIRVFFI